MITRLTESINEPSHSLEVRQELQVSRELQVSQVSQELQGLQVSQELQVSRELLRLKLASGQMVLLAQ